ncbi:MAG: CapA family protein [Actinobacteria bacterium]|nr:CapA family protein [Actinomycetota bacterium]
MRRAALVLCVMTVSMPALAHTDLRPDIERPPARPSPDSFTMAFTGDTLIHMGVSRAASRHGDPYDFAPLFAPVRHHISGADLAICHLEVPLDPTSGDLSGFPLFSAPREVAAGLVATGFDGCSTASNHSLDRGVQGIVDTIQILEEAGMRQAGMARNEGDEWDATVYEVAGARVAHLSATYSFNGLRLPAGKEWMAQLLDVDQILRYARRAKGAGADLVVVSVHCCVEYQTMPTSHQTEAYRALIESHYVDLVVSHHAHVVQPVERVGGEYIIYGLGNFVSGQFFLPNTSDGVIAVVTARSDGSGWWFDEVTVVPTTVMRGSYEVWPASPGSPSFERTMTTVNGLGAAIAPYEPPDGMIPWGVD